REGDTKPIETSFQLQPINNLRSSTDVSQIRKDDFLIDRSHHHIGAETFRLRLDFLPYFGFCKENIAVQYFKLSIIIPDNTFAKIVCEVEEVAFSGMHLGLETQTFQLGRAGRSEERRVGKGCRYGWPPSDERENNHQRM